MSNNIIYKETALHYPAIGKYHYLLENDPYALERILKINPDCDQALFTNTDLCFDLANTGKKKLNKFIGSANQALDEFRRHNHEIVNLYLVYDWPGTTICTSEHYGCLMVSVRLEKGISLLKKLYLEENGSAGSCWDDLTILDHGKVASFFCQHEEFAVLFSNSSKLAEVPFNINPSIVNSKTTIKGYELQNANELFGIGNAKNRI